MLVCFGVYGGDVDRLKNLLTWIFQLGGCADHEAAIVADAAMEARQVFHLKDEALKSFRSVEIESTDQSVVGWPQGANSLFLAAARFAEKRNVPFLFMEPDAVPLCPGWLDRIDIHYTATGARYMGALVKCSNPRLPSVHLPGVSCYPSDVYSKLGPTIVGNPTMAFDISTAHISVPKVTDSKAFQALWGEKNNPPTFAAKGVPGTGTFDLGFIDPKAALFHRNKDGTLIDLLRKRAGIVPKTFIQLGRFGDIILLLPALKHISDTTGSKPILICSSDYASVLEGVSYVQPYPMRLSWFHGMSEAIKHGTELFGNVTVLQCHALNWGVDIKQWPNFMTSMWDRTGVPLSLMTELPLIFDKRNPERESSHLKSTNGKPYIVINTSGVSSPFNQKKMLMSALSHLTRMVNFIDVGAVQCHRIYDLLGLMDGAIGGVHIDTATLHLARACQKPYIAFTVDGWCSSVPCGNCVMEVKYSQFNNSLHQIVKTISSWL